MLVIKQAVQVPHLQNHLLCPIQMHLNDVIVSEVPMFLSRRPDDTSHTLQVIDPMDDGSILIIILSLKGIYKFFPVYKPTIAEWENEDYHPHIQFPAEEPVGTLNIQAILSRRRAWLTSGDRSSSTLPLQLGESL